MQRNHCSLRLLRGREEEEERDRDINKDKDREDQAGLVVVVMVVARQGHHSSSHCQGGTSGEGGVSQLQLSSWPGAGTS